MSAKTLFSAFLAAFVAGLTGLPATVVTTGLGGGGGTGTGAGGGGGGGGGADFLLPKHIISPS